jgi:hypothetical protein
MVMTFQFQAFPQTLSLQNLTFCFWAICEDTYLVTNHYCFQKVDFFTAILLKDTRKFLSSYFAHH